VKAPPFLTAIIMIELDHTLTQRVNGEKKQVHYVAKIETHNETTIDSTKRSRIAYFTGKRADIDFTDLDTTWIALVVFPACVSCSTGFISIDGTEIDVRKLEWESFCLLPAALFDVWQNRVFEDNPHLLESKADEAVTGGDEEKKSKS